jgi:hypothetical protein
LKSGEHTVRIVTLGQADERAKGKQIAIQEAVTYRASK